MRDRAGVGATLHANGTKRGADTRFGLGARERARERERHLTISGERSDDVDGLAVSAFEDRSASLLDSCVECNVRPRRSGRRRHFLGGRGGRSLEHFVEVASQLREENLGEASTLLAHEREEVIAVRLAAPRAEAATDLHAVRASNERRPLARVE